MKDKSLLATLALSLGLALACTGGTTPTVATPPAPPPPPVASNGAIGVAECDEYITKMRDCLAKMDAATKAASESAFTQTTDAWRAAASTPEGRAGLQMGCSAALNSMPPTCTGASTTTTTTTVTAGPNGATVTTPGTTVNAGPNGATVTTPTGTTTTTTAGTKTTTNTTHTAQPQYAQPADMTRSRPNSTGGSSGGGGRSNGGGSSSGGGGSSAGGTHSRPK